MAHPYLNTVQARTELAKYLVEKKGWEVNKAFGWATSRAKIVSITPGAIVFTLDNDETFSAEGDVLPSLVQQAPGETTPRTNT